MGANAIELRSCDKCPAYCWDRNVGEWYDVNEMLCYLPGFFMLKKENKGLGGGGDPLPIPHPLTWPPQENIGESQWHSS